MVPLGFKALLLECLCSGVLSQTINADSLLQEIDGLGISQASTRANEFSASDLVPCQQGLDYLFSTTTGAGFAIVRNRSGSSTNDAILPRLSGSPSGAPHCTDYPAQYIKFYAQEGVKVTRVGS
ncbi:hypothetical protein BKA70DRAFT_829965 [Coprinopsis sp. MPI-PUGE-AT-0042]|nr:hypothetical protein BKA70DRAFT_829965 [Coprinopsis sp. MPI-PUGE-AT-0042]